jgi:exopolyphosphatase/pppGpp-phosphohydrolase
VADTTNTALAADVAKDGRFGAAALAETVKAVEAYSDRIHKEFHAAPERTYVVGSSGLFAAIHDKPELIKENQNRLTEAVKQATGLSVKYIDVRREAELSIDGIVPKPHRKTGLLIDIGGGNTKGGCMVGSEKYATFGVPYGTLTFSELAKKNGAADAASQAKLYDEKVEPLLKKELAKLPDLAKRDPIYLSGGVVWAAATFAHPADAKAFTVLTLKDVEQLEARLAAAPADTFPDPDFSAVTAGKARLRATAEWARVKKVYPPAQLLAGLPFLREFTERLGRRSITCSPGTAIWAGFSPM